MGTRIYKRLGYGLTDVQCSGGQVADPRINTSSRLFASRENVTSDYLAYLTECVAREAASTGEPSDLWIDVSLEREFVSAALERKGELDSPVTWNAEAGWQEILLVQPVGYPEWTRFDDPIDHFEETELHKPVEPRIVPAPRGIYPFEGLYADSRDGRRLDSTAKRLIDRLLNAEGDKKGDFRRAADHLARTMGFADADEAQRFIAPLVPGDVRRLCEWGELFTSPDVWRELRPMLYVYWA